MVDTTWTNGGGDGKASTAANWSNGIDVGYNVIFDGTSTANCTFDYDGQLGAFTIGAGYSGTITQASDMHITGYSQAGGTFTGVITKWVYCGGDWTMTGGTLTVYKTNIVFPIGTHNFTSIASQFNGLDVYGELVVKSNMYVYGVTATAVFNLRENAVISIDAGKNLEIYVNRLASQIFLGEIIGSGTCILDVDAASKSLAISTAFTCPLTVKGLVGLTSNAVVTLTADFDVSVITILSAHASNTVTLNINGHSLTANSITIGTRGILSNSAATDSVISCASFDSSAGTFTEANTQVILNGNGTLKTGAHKFDELVQRDGVTTTLGSNITVTNEFDTAGSFINGAYSITHENPEKRLIAPMVNPIIRNSKRSPFLNNRFTKNIEIEVV